MYAAKRHDAGHDPEGTLAGAAGSRGVGAGAARNMPSTCSPTSRCARCISTWRGLSARAAQRRASTPNSSCGCRGCCTRRFWRCSTAATIPNAPSCWSGWPCSNCISAEDSATFIPLPHEPRCRRAADIVLGDPTGSHEIETLAREVGTSARTLSRLFSSETQLSFKSWCQRARIAAAIERLSMEANVSVKQLAADLGYASVPAFSHAFRQVTGKTPTEFAGRNSDPVHGRMPSHAGLTHAICRKACQWYLAGPFVRCHALDCDPPSP